MKISWCILGLVYLKINYPAKLRAADFQDLFILRLSRFREKGYSPTKGILLFTKFVFWGWFVNKDGRHALCLVDFYFSSAKTESKLSNQEALLIFSMDSQQIWPSWPLIGWYIFFFKMLWGYNWIWTVDDRRTDGLKNIRMTRWLNGSGELKSKTGVHVLVVAIMNSPPRTYVHYKASASA